MSATDTPDPTQRLVNAAEPHVPFDGWSQATFDAAVAESGVDPVVARALFPRGAVDLAIAFHKQGDALMLERLAAEDLSELRIREKITHALRTRLEICPDREIVRRGSTLFSLPAHAPTGAELIWGTADAIWNAIGDSSRDVNWYTKRATLSGVYSATLLYWLGDDSEGHAATWAFLDRRIENVMQFEKFKARVRLHPLGKALTAPLAIFDSIRAPEDTRDMPGQWHTPAK